MLPILSGKIAVLLRLDSKECRKTSYKETKYNLQELLLMSSLKRVI